MTSSPRRPGARPGPPWTLIALLALVIAVVWWLSRERPQPSAPPPGAVLPPAADRAVNSHNDLHPQDRGSAAAEPGERDRRATPPDEGPRAEAEWRPGRPLLPSGSGRAAIIVDDVGYSSDAVADFEAVGYPLTLSVLPLLDSSRTLARACAASGFEVMVHLPMEPVDSRLDPGPGCIKVEMADTQIAALVQEHLETVPGAVGANNHMGSRATADPRVMRAVLSVLRERGLFFVDSLTTGDSVAGEVAAAMSVPCAKRNVFLDTNFAPEPTTDEEFFDAAQERVRQLGRIAQREGAAIGICHYRPQTATMLALILPALQESGLQIVSVSDLIAPATRFAVPAPPPTPAPSR